MIEHVVRYSPMSRTMSTRPLRPSACSARVGLRRDAMVLHQRAREVIGARFLRVLEIRRLARGQVSMSSGDSPTSFPTRRWAYSSYSEPQAAPTVRMMIS
jgi:hypothetical protein